MKTKNNVQKTITKSLAVIISLVLLSITVNAQEFWKTVFENNSLNQIAMVMTNEFEASSAPVSAQAPSEVDAYAAFSVLDNEKALEIEDWMMDETLFGSATAAYFILDTEEALEVEDWMKSLAHFDGATVDFVEETESSLKMENWMTNDKIWNN